MTAISRRWKRTARMLWRCALIGAATSIRAQAQAQARPARESGASIDSLLDATMQAEMAREHVPGGVLVAMLPGHVVHARAFGLADLSSGRPVTLEQTTFGVSSISKTFTAAALVGLSDAGRIDLAAPVAERVTDPRLARRVGGVTAANLLTHTGGFDELTIGVSARSLHDVVPLGAYLAGALPPIVRRPGRTSSYSNHGYALAGFLIEIVSGETFASYLDRALFRPLRMDHSSFQQPLPDSLEANRARAYTFADTAYEALPRIYFNDIPASALFTTGADMAKWMRLLLSGDAARDSTEQMSPLSSRTITALLTRQFANDARLPGLSFGMSERTDMGVHTFEQGGDWQDYSSDLLLAPSDGIGLFVAFNAESGSGISTVLWPRLLRALGAGSDAAASARQSAPSRATGTTAQRTAAPALDAFDGTYRLNRFSRHTLARLGALTGDVPIVGIGDMSMFRREGMAPLTPLAPDLARRGSDTTLVAFRNDSLDGVRLLFLERDPYDAYEQIPWYERRMVTLAVLAAAIAATLARLLSSSLPRVRRSAVGRALLPGAQLALDGGVSAYVLATAVVIGAADPWEFQYGLPGTVRLVLLVPWVLAALTVVADASIVRRAVQADSRRWWTSLVVLQVALSLAFIAPLWHWRLMTHP